MCAMQNSIGIRLARLEDKDAVVAFCQNTFSWGDYIADVFVQWAQDPNGKLLVATIDHQPVGILHAAFLGNGVAWLEGMRVHPDFRRRGISTRLDTAARQAAREHNYRVARLVTSIKNIAAQKTLDTARYRRVAKFNEWEAEPLQEGFSALRVASNIDMQKIIALWRASEMSQASHTVVPDRHWHWTPLDETRLREQIAANETRFASNGIALVTAFDERDWNGLNIQTLAGDPETMFAIARAVRSEAAYRGYAHIEAILADYAPLNVALERAGYHSDGGMFIYEQEL
jgi:GNAT superfamily N-acetyltransferase